MENDIYGFSLEPPYWFFYSKIYTGYLGAILSTIAIVMDVKLVIRVQILDEAVCI